MSAGFTVRLERVFQGPMDLLLHLVREQEVEIHDIEINRVITGYLEYLRTLRDLDLELAGDFLVMAATLMSIKSRSLLPGESVDLESDLDPRDELIQRLIEYRRFKEASDQLGSLHETRARQHARGDTGAEDRGSGPVLEIGELTAWDLLAAFSRLMRETLGGRPHRVFADPRPLRFYVNELARRMRTTPELSLRALFVEIDGQPSRESLIGSFCALLELVKLGLVSVVQETKRSDIGIRLREEHALDLESILRSSIFDDEADDVGEATEPATLAAESPPPYAPLSPMSPVSMDADGGERE